MDESHAMERADKVRVGTDVPADFVLEWIKQRYIELGHEAPDVPDALDTQEANQKIILVEDRLVWIARFAKAISWWELAIDDKSGKLVRVQRSR